MGKGKGLRAEMEGFKDHAEDDWHWERDAAQRKIMLKIKERRPDAIFEAFSNSAPYYMTVSGCCGGNFAAMEEHGIANDGKSQSGTAATVACAALVDSVEAFEDALKMRNTKWENYLR